MAGLGHQEHEVEMTNAQRVEERQHPTPDPPSETIQTTIPLRATLGKARSSRFDVGDSSQSALTPRSKKRALDERDKDDNTKKDDSATDGASPIKLQPVKLGRLHQRRVSTSPEKFNKGKVELLPIRTDLAAAEGPETKRQRTNTLIHGQYDEAGEALIAPGNVSFSGKKIPSPPKLPSPLPESPKKPFDLLEEMIQRPDILLHVISCLTIPSLISLYAISKRFHYHFNLNVTACTLSIVRTLAPGSETIFPWRSYRHLSIKDPVQRKKQAWVGVSNQVLTGIYEYEHFRDVPSLRWLQMVVWRHGVCTAILIQMAKEGLRCPQGTVNVLKRLWYLLDLPLNHHRVSLIHSTSYFDDETLKKATQFFMKLDMFFTDPEGHVYPPPPPNMIPPIPNYLPWVQPGTAPTPAQLSAWRNYNNPPPLAPRAWANTGPVGTDMRELLIGARHLTTLWRVLHGWSPDETRGGQALTRLEVLKLWIRHKYKPHHDPHSRPHTLRQMVLDVPWYDIGTAEMERTVTTYLSTDEHQTHRVAINPLMTSTTEELKHENQQCLFKMEYMLDEMRVFLPWVKPRETLLRPDELVLQETVRRRMGLHKFWAEMMLYGFCDKLGRNYRVMSEEELQAWSRGRKMEKDRVFEPNNVPGSVEEMDDRIRQAKEEEFEKLVKEKLEKEQMAKEDIGETVHELVDEQSAMDTS